MWDDPELYELENADDPAFDLAFWTALLRERAPRRVLELACGTGRLTLPLAALGIAEEIVALDSSKPFLERLRSRLPSSGSAVRVVDGDMRGPRLDGEAFDLVMVSFNSLAYLATRDDRLSCLRTARSLLGPGGALAFDLVAPRYDFLSEATERCPPLRADADHPAPEHGVARFLRSYTDTYDPATQTLHSTNRYEIHREDGRVEHRIADLDWHIYFPEELELLLEAADLRVTERFGDYARGPWTTAVPPLPLGRGAALGSLAATAR
jgi:SAM-dependent methyltransferase